MDERKKILFFSTRFFGHLLQILELAAPKCDNTDIMLFVLSWDKFTLTPDGQKLIEKNGINWKEFKGPVLHHLPPEAGLPRARALLDTETESGSKLAEELRLFNPSLIVYDYFCIEAFILSETRGIPGFCCQSQALNDVDGFRRGPYDELREVDDDHRFEGFESELSWIAEKLKFDVRRRSRWLYGCLVPITKHNVSFSFATKNSPVLMPRGLTFESFYFLGSRTMNFNWTPLQKSTFNGDPVVFVSLGTVVQHYEGPALFYQRRAEFEKAFFNMVLEHPKTKFLVTGLQSLDVHRDNVLLQDFVDQTSVLKDQANLLICHGGNGTVNEAIRFKVPMIVFPFFNDQFANARFVENQGIGEYLKDPDNLSDCLKRMLNRNRDSFDFSGFSPSADTKPADLFWEKVELVHSNLKK